MNHRAFRGLAYYFTVLWQPGQASPGELPWLVIKWL